MSEAALARRPDGLLVELLRVGLPPLDARDLRGHQGGAVLEIARAMPSPHVEPAVMRRQRLEVLPALIHGGGVTRRGVRERADELIVGHLEQGG